jgi:hypothetical protein
MRLQPRCSRWLGIATVLACDLGLSGKSAVRDLWAKKRLATVANGQTFQVAPHASAFYKVTPEKSR